MSDPFSFPLLLRGTIFMSATVGHDIPNLGALQSVVADTFVEEAHAFRVRVPAQVSRPKKILSGGGGWCGLDTRFLPIGTLSRGRARRDDGIAGRRGGGGFSITVGGSAWVFYLEIGLVF